MKVGEPGTGFFLEGKYIILKFIQHLLSAVYT